MNITRLAREVFRRTRYFSTGRVAAFRPSILLSPRKVQFRNDHRQCSVFSKSPDYSEIPLMDLGKYESLSSDTLDSLTDYFEEIVEADPKLAKADVSYSDGVLTVKLGSPFGTYVINRQTPNRQLWLSSPTSGPKRYDHVDGNWIYKHDGISLHELLQNELEKIIAFKVNFLKLASNKK